jgi:hypothetical protein
MSEYWFTRVLYWRDVMSPKSRTAKSLTSRWADPVWALRIRVHPGRATWASSYAICIPNFILFLRKITGDIQFNL